VIEHAERPWGSYTVLAEGDSFKVKAIEVRPGQRLSYQRHQRRAEHWFVVSGRPRYAAVGPANARAACRGRAAALHEPIAATAAATAARAPIIARARFMAMTVVTASPCPQHHSPNPAKRTPLWDEKDADRQR
jgi:hypothetical protein